MNKFHFAVVAFMAVVPAAAQDYRVKSGEPLAGAGAARGAWLVRDKDCQILRRHVPVADVQHQPGRDGVSADLNPGPDLNERARNFAIAITVVADDYLPPVGPYGHATGGEGFLGFIEIRDGVPYMDGEPLDGLSADDLLAVCDQASPPDKPQAAPPDKPDQ